MIKYLLYPLTWLFTIIVHIRNTLYDWNILPGINSRLPIISVGNIQVGGTGKTPFVIALSKQLIAHNIKPLIITRGYKRNTKHQIIFNNITEHSAQEVGDEPYYIKQVINSVPIIIDYNKKNAVKTANQMNDIDCILLDDGYQSRYINKDLDIVLTSFGEIKNFNLMPVGDFREPVANLKRAHFIYNTKHIDSAEQHLKRTFKIIRYQNGNIEDEAQSNYLKPMIAFCGIANQNYFISILKNMNIEINKEIKFENHVNYDEGKYHQLKAANPNNLSFITTYKDFVKLNAKFKNTYTIYVLEMNLIIDDNKLLDKIKTLISEN